jgi:transaldolase
VTDAPTIPNRVGRREAAAQHDTEMPSVANLKTKIFADGADANDIVELSKNPLIQGFTTNPTLMRAAGVAEYETFARDLLAKLPAQPVSFEVFADEFSEMERQARLITTWADNVYVKIPVTNTRRESSAALIRRLAGEGIKLNVTALLTLEQVRTVGAALAGGPPSFVSVFAGRIADTGRDPVPMMRRAVEILESRPQRQLIWASPRELLNLFQADQVGCHVVTMTPELLRKLPLVGRDLDTYSLDTVKMFHDDARAAGYAL